MSVDCRIITGLTIEFAHDLNSFDFKKYHKFVEKYPELDEYTYDRADREGKLLLIVDGMSGEFLRLVQVDRLINGNMGDGNEFVELAAPNSSFNLELTNKMREIYKEYTGEYPALSDFKYAMWSQWY